MRRGIFVLWVDLFEVFVIVYCIGGYDSGVGIDGKIDDFG